ncbi:MAG TPA: CoA transferase subunit A [Actinobacteria bacterium]|nr:CoA transferase subunit A [Actinomycetota bacterium]
MRPRFVDADEAVTSVEPDSTLGVGGMQLTAAPMALVRALVRRRTRIGRLVTSPSASLQADLPIAAGLVDELVSPYVGFEHLGLAPAFRRAVEGGSLRVLEIDEGSLTHALHAGASGIPFVPCPPGIDLTDIPRVDPTLFRRVVDPFDGTERWAVPAIRPDTVFVAAAVADEHGNVAFDRFPFTDRTMALAARRLLVEVEEVVPAGSLADRPPGTTLPAFLVDAIVVAPGGCLPTEYPGRYGRDDETLRAYLAAAKTGDPDAVAPFLEEARR